MTVTIYRLSAVTARTSTPATSSQRLPHRGKQELLQPLLTATTMQYNYDRNWRIWLHRLSA
eukprot:9405763-Prorocentrum_lima.AAC.1